VTWVLIGVAIVVGFLILVGLLPILLWPKGRSVREGQLVINELMKMEREKREGRRGDRDE